LNDLERENRWVLDLVQAMVGAVSSNVRRVGIQLDNEGIRIQFILERDTEEDREEIEDILFEFEALQNGPVAVEASVLIHAGDLQAIALYPRVVYGRRE